MNVERVYCLYRPYGTVDYNDHTAGQKQIYVLCSGRQYELHFE